LSPDRNTAGSNSRFTFLDRSYLLKVKSSPPTPTPPPLDKYRTHPSIYRVFLSPQQLVLQILEPITPSVSNIEPKALQYKGGSFGVFKSILRNTASSAGLQIPLSRSMLGLNPEPLRLWHWHWHLAVRRSDHSVRSYPLTRIIFAICHSNTHSSSLIKF
jgi:hypothetical protein